MAALSHQLNILRIGQELAARGHNFSMLISSTDAISIDALKNRSFPGFQVVTFDGPQGVGTEDWASSLSRDPQECAAQLFRTQALAADYLYADKQALERMSNAGYDLILRDAVMWPAALLEDLLQLPSVEVLPLPVTSLQSAPQSIPNPVAYIPQLGVSLTPNMSFWQRVQNYLMSFLTLLLQRQVNASQDEFIKRTGHSFRLHDTGISSAAAFIAVVDWALEYPRPVPPRVHMVGPVLAQDPKPVTPELEAFLSRGLSEGHGAVFVSMGTLARMNSNELHSMAQALSALPNPVLWKFNLKHLPVNMSMDSLNLGKNIMLTDWAPQNDVLGHPVVKAFLTQAGINSLHEAAYHGKPIVSVPLIVDQPANAAKGEYHGFGLTVDPSKLSPVNSNPLKTALTRILTEPSFTISAQKVQKRLINKPRQPAQLAADVIEQVLRNKKKAA
ncbi:hypothetical protein WJX82_007403 [Trebouxia sp. C0006]